MVLLLLILTYCDRRDSSELSSDLLHMLFVLNISKADISSKIKSIVELCACTTAHIAQNKWEAGMQISTQPSNCSWVKPSVPKCLRYSEIHFDLKAWSGQRAKSGLSIPANSLKWLATSKVTKLGIAYSKSMKETFSSSLL